MGGYVVRRQLNATRRQRFSALFLAVLVILGGALQSAGTAHADEINPIVQGSVKLTDKTSAFGPTYVWNDVQISGEWRIPNQSGKEGDTFRIGLPAAFKGVNGSFELQGSGQDPLSYGTCVVSASEVVCTLNANVVGKNNVGGTFFVNTQVASTYTGNNVTLTINGNASIVVDLPNGQTDIGYSPQIPRDIAKIGYFSGDPYDTLVWKIRIPGQELSGNTLTIDDPFTVPGSSLTVKPGTLTFYRIPNNNPLCWNEPDRTECRTMLYSNDGGSYPDVTAQIEDSSRIHLVYNKTSAFSADDLYILEFRLAVGEQILVGAKYPNNVTINGNSYEGVAVRDASGGGTGSGDTVGHLNLRKSIENNTGNAVSQETAFPVAYSYQLGGQAKTGTLEVKADGSLASLYNIPNGTVVTLTEQVPAVTGVDFGDPTFSGTGVTDGVPDANSAQVTVEGTKTLDITLTNRVNPKLGAVQVTPGVCAPGASEPSEPTVVAGPTDGISYSQPKIVKNGDQVTVTVVATPETGKEIDDQNVPAGWAPNGDGTFTYTTTITQPSCTQVVAPAVPDVTPGVCPVDSTTPAQPVVTGVTDTDEIDYSEPTFVTNGSQVTVTVTATPKAGHRFDTANLPSGWTVVDGVVTYSTTITQPQCAVPVVPTIDAGTCPADSSTPTAPTATIAAVDGLEFTGPEIKVADGKVTVTATATAKTGYQIGGPLPEGWTRVDESHATFSAVRDQPACKTPAPSPEPTATITPTPASNVSPTPAPSVTVTPAASPVPVRPSLPRTGS